MKEGLIQLTFLNCPQKTSHAKVYSLSLLKQMQHQKKKTERYKIRAEFQVLPKIELKKSGVNISNNR